MYCRYCGNQLDDNAKFCACCGKKVELRINANSETQVKGESKAVMGAVFVLLGWIGLIIGILVFRKRPYERDSFIKSWLITYVILGVLSCIVYLLLMFFLPGGENYVLY